MSNFFCEDTVALKADSAIVGTIAFAWTDIEMLHVGGFGDCYIHHSLSSQVQKAWSKDQRLLPGYVVIELMQPLDGFILISESSLDLVDRSLAVGDVVKKNPSDPQSGTVISTSILCTLKPSCTLERYSMQNMAHALQHFPSNGPQANVPGNSNPNLHGFYVQGGLQLQDSSPDEPLSLQVPASDLTHWNIYREEDIIIYKDWIGQVHLVLYEVTIRLSNGSVVTVHDPDELEEPFYVPGSTSYKLAQRLDRAGFYQHHPRQNHFPVNGKCQTYPVGDACSPGQIVVAKKGNLRRGRWIFGAYDPNIEPRGIVTELRCISLEVDWKFPNIFNPHRSQFEAPPSILDTVDFNPEDITKYDRSRIPIQANVAMLPNASHAPDFGFGRAVRFKDPAGAAANYSSPGGDLKGSETNASFQWLPRSETQGFDMNVFEVTQTKTTALVQWQDNSTTEEIATGISPYLNPDENEIWPGDKVSYQPSEVRLVQDGIPIVRSRSVGIVQSVNPNERIARVRWLDHASYDIEAEEKLWQLATSNFGEISDRHGDASLYQLAAHPALETNRGELAVIFPDPMPPLGVRDIYQYTMLAGFSISEFLTPPVRTGRTEPATSYGLPSSRMAPLTAAIERASQLFQRNVAEPPPFVPSKDIDWFGEVTDVCVDGTVIVRLGASSDARSVKLPPERVMVIDSGDAGDNSTSSEYSNTDESVISGNRSLSEADDSMSEDNESIRTDDESASSDESVEAVDVTIDYEGGRNLDPNSDEDEVMWLTEGEDEDEPDQRVDEADTMEHDAARLETDETSLSHAERQTMPPQFAILEESAPLDHYYIDIPRVLDSGMMRKVMKEHKILQSSLPDGVFVRAWENRLDLLRIMIIGPADTPYEFAPFLIDLQFSSSYPLTPPDAYFHSWTDGLGRVNPNLYEDGKICLSLLGTWHTDERNEGWSPKKSTILQIVVSIMGLVLVRDPYYNEAGFEVLRGSAESQVSSALYSEKAYVLSKGFIKTALHKRPPGFEDIITWMYLSDEGPQLLKRVLHDCPGSFPGVSIENTHLNEKAKADGDAPSRMKISAGALILLQENLEGLDRFLENDQAG